LFTNYPKLNLRDTFLQSVQKPNLVEVCLTSVLPQLQSATCIKTPPVQHLLI